MTEPEKFLDKLNNAIGDVKVLHPYIGKNFGYPLDSRYRWRCLPDRKGYVGYYKSDIKVVRFFQGEASLELYDKAEIIEIITDLVDSSYCLVLAREKKRKLYRLYTIKIDVSDERGLELDEVDHNFFESSIPCIYPHNWNIVVVDDRGKVCNIGNQGLHYFPHMTVAMAKGHIVKYKGDLVLVNKQEYTMKGHIYVSPGLVCFQTETKIVYITSDQIYETDLLPREHLISTFISMQGIDGFCFSVEDGKLIRTMVEVYGSSPDGCAEYVKYNNAIYCKRTLSDKLFPIEKDNDSLSGNIYPEFVHPRDDTDEFPCYTHDGRQLYLRDQSGSYFDIDTYGIYEKSEHEVYVVNPMLSQFLTLKELLSLRTRLCEL